MKNQALSKKGSDSGNKVYLFDAVLIFALLAAICGSIWLFHSILEEKEPQPFFQIAISEAGRCRMEIRLNEVNMKGSETYVKSNIYVTFDASQNPGNVYVAIKDPNHYPSRYTLKGEYYPKENLYEGKSEIELYPKEGSLLDFPFDDLAFDFSIKVLSKIESRIELKHMHLYQKINGFLLKQTPKHQSVNTGLQMTFDLDRKLESKAFPSILAILIFAYIVFTVLYVREESLLITAVVTFFVSTWSFTSAVTPFVKGVPTWVDRFLLFFSIFLLFVVLIKSIMVRLQKKY